MPRSTRRLGRALNAHDVAYCPASSGRRSRSLTTARRLVTSIAVMAATLGGPALTAQPLAAGTVAPEIELPVLSGGRISLSSHRGHPVVVSFWGTWCAPCKDAFPQLVRIHRAFASVGLRILAVDGLDQESSTKAIRMFVEQYGATFPVLLDEHGSMRQVYRVTDVPMTVFIDTSGVIRLVHSGPISPLQLDAGVAMLMPQR